jgi:hypothetical protein
VDPFAGVRRVGYLRLVAEREHPNASPARAMASTSPRDMKGVSFSRGTLAKGQ